MVDTQGDGWPTRVIGHGCYAQRRFKRRTLYTLSPSDGGITGTIGGPAHQVAGDLERSWRTRTSVPGWTAVGWNGLDNFAVESFMDEAGIKVGADPFAVRYGYLKAEGHPNAGLWRPMRWW